MDERVLSALRAGPWMLGERFSGADILVASMGQFIRTLLPPGDVVDAYLARAAARPALARARAKDAG
jgi:glutathione S-transferase